MRKTMKSFKEAVTEVAIEIDSMTKYNLSFVTKEDRRVFSNILVSFGLASNTIITLQNVWEDNTSKNTPLPKELKDASVNLLAYGSLLEEKVNEFVNEGL